MQSGRARVRQREKPASVAAPGARTGRTPLLVAEHNLRVTLEAIRRAGPLTRLELARRSGLSAPGLTNILRRLSENGLVTASRRRGEGSGQPSVEFAINPNGAFAIGIRLAGASSEAVLIDLGGQVRDRVIFDPGADLAAAIGEILARLRSGPAQPQNIVGIGIGASTPGALDPGSLSAGLSPLRVMVERDCVVGALAERMFGAGPVDGGLVLIVIDAAVRAGLLLQGVPFGGVHGRAGDIGAMRTGPDQVPLDSVVGLGALHARLTPAEKKMLQDGEDLPMTPAVCAWIETAAGHLLDAIIAMAGFVAPGAILIGGDLPRNAIDALIARMAVERGDRTIRPVSTPWISPIRPASFAGGGIAVGAALLPLFDQLLPSPMAAV